tara:strand:- start:713 stop:1690 length:978 start_codon:yes stop_codon:yes gene_type:complete
MPKSKNIDKILIILGEPNSVFLEILFKFFISKKYLSLKKTIIMIGSYNLFIKQMNKLNYNLNIHIIKKIDQSKINKINLINVNYNFQKEFSKITNHSNNYISECFDMAIEIIKKNKNIGLINGPISKKHFLKKKYFGMTEYIAEKTKSKNQVMLIYNKKLSVSPITTHIPIKHVSKNLTKRKIINNVTIINSFFRLRFNKTPSIAILGLNPHCETIDKISEEKRIINPSIKILKKKKIDIEGPFSADTFFLKKNIKKFDVVIGMYHDQVLTPIKTLFKFNAINITLGLPFIRVSPDHGPNSSMLGKNLSDPSSIFLAIKFFNSIK